MGSRLQVAAWYGWGRKLPASTLSSLTVTWWKRWLRYGKPTILYAIAAPKKRQGRNGQGRGGKLRKYKKARYLLIPGLHPTDVGKGMMLLLESASYLKHPHGCGEKSGLLFLTDLTLETPPRAWGMLDTYRITFKRARGRDGSKDAWRPTPQIRAL